MYISTFPSGTPIEGSSAALTKEALASTVHSVGPYTLCTANSRQRASSCHSAASIASPPTSSARNASSSRSLKPARNNSRSCDGVQSSTATCSLASNSSSAAPSRRTASGITTSAWPPSSCTSCFTEASKQSEAFTLTRRPLPSPAYTLARNAPYRFTTLWCAIITPFGCPVDPDV